MPSEPAVRSIRLLAGEVLPALRGGRRLRRQAGLG
jgi:hypothetical protein